MSDHEAERTRPTSAFAFNAVKLTPKQVADTFIAPPAFADIIASANAVLTGPRGSGKTTLLKMLQSEALENWLGPEANALANDFRAIGVFVGADRLWTEQLKNAPAEVAESVSTSAYGLHIARSLTSAIQYSVSKQRQTTLREHCRYVLGSDQERELAEAFRLAFELPGSGGSLKAVARAIALRLAELGNLRNRPDRLLSADWIKVDPIGAVEAVITVFNSLVDAPEQRWALLFDEMELAPASLVEQLMRRLRAGPQLIDFKLSMAPITPEANHLGGTVGAIGGQDFELISLVGNGRLADTAFTTRLFEEYLARVSGTRGVSLHRVFGESFFDGRESFNAVSARPQLSGHAYGKDGPVLQAMRALARKDPSFSTYLETRKIDLDNLDAVQGTARAATIRKIRNIVVAREHFRGQGGRRSRKTLEIYTGANSLVSFPDGNPRMAQVLIRELGIALQSSLNGKVGVAAQSEAIEATVNRFIGLIEAQEGLLLFDKIITVLDLVEAIGDALAHRLIDLPFSADVPSGIYVDAKVSSELLPLVERAVNVGALVPARLNGASLDSNVMGAKLRLNYLLSPRFHLPFRQGKLLALSTVLLESRMPVGGSRTTSSNAPNNRTPRGSRDSTQLDLPGGFD
ncbi:hypothetical protein [Curtobacterium poinsettiae]|uniref:ORC-CDC6 family AAA ATPase n=1 Tax=Curtobacterium poinsettiae TaxID=159612 RepID=UPI00217D8C5D|nr:hypothetical protein [Curtobacterium flaccumfaciens]MCS6578699.1 hypothetical protein [Curtobacterium flaccumfaciens]